MKTRPPFDVLIFLFGLALIVAALGVATAMWTGFAKRPAKVPPYATKTITDRF